MSPTPCHLERFLTAQQDSYEQAIVELREGRKRTHWMWFIFPQFFGLGSSETARFYAIRSREEAVDYLAHPVLGFRLVECCKLLLGVEGKSAREILGSPDDMKLRSSATLFSSVSAPNSVFADIIEKYFNGCPDQLTLDLLGNRS